ncbi:MAG: shikimate dehydrogenase [Alphaproteobacteria bacterium]|nr:shikimate dehydrogenase [Alphaproteobacteria bacterium]
MTISGMAKLAGVMGWPVGHSRSPRLHGYWLAHYGIDGAYVPLAVKPENLAQALRALPVLGFAGCNITLPHKVPALAALDEVTDQARRIGAVNTVVVQAGRLVGSNTDAPGFLESLQADAPGWRAEVGPAVMLGAGGAARAVAIALLDAGVPRLTVCNRSFARAEGLAHDLGDRAQAAPWSAAEAALADAALLVNATSLGMQGQPSLPLDLARLPAEAVVNDLVYSPLQTGLLAAARARGNPAVDGLGMLLHQAVPGFAAWFGRRPAVTAELRAAVLRTLQD